MGIAGIHKHSEYCESRTLNRKKIYTAWEGSSEYSYFRYCNFSAFMLIGDCVGGYVKKVSHNLRADKYGQNYIASVLSMKRITLVTRSIGKH